MRQSDQIIDRKPTVTALMLTLNSEGTIRRALESISDLVQEIVVVDGGSTDKTLEVARSYGARILSRRFEGFDRERNAGLEVANGHWILSLDSDEVISDTLRRELKQFVAQDLWDAIFVPRLDYVAGHVMKSFYPDYQLKLFKNGCITFEGRVHETPRFSRAVRRQFAVNPLINFSDRTMAVRFRREIRYWTLALPGKKSVRRRALALPITIARYPLLLLFQRNFLRDGLHGLTMAILFLSAYIIALHRVIALEETRSQGNVR